MAMSDPIADMLTRIRNANTIRRPVVECPYSTFKENILTVLRDERYIKDYEVVRTDRKQILRIYLRYLPGNRPVITRIQKISTPGVRRYADRRTISAERDRIGLTVLTTPLGVLSHKKARELGVGGEVLFHVW